MAKIGAKELQLKALRETRVAPPKKTKPAAAQPQPETPAPTVKETTVKTARKAAKPAAKKAPTKKAPASSRRKAPSRASAARQVASKADGGVRPGSKLEAIGALLMSDKGVTASEICAIAGWKRVSVPPIIARLGKKMKKSSEAGGIRYFAI